MRLWRVRERRWDLGLFSGWWRNRDVTASVERLLDDRLSETVTAINSVGALTEERHRLLEEITGLRAEIDNLNEELATERATIERDRLGVEHKLGLEKVRQQQDAELAQKELDAARAQINMERDLAIKEARLPAAVEALAMEIAAKLHVAQKLILPTAEFYRDVDG